MTLSPEQISELKEQLRQQVQHLPAQQKQLALQQIESMSSEALESLLEEQRSRAGSPKADKDKTIFRMIVDKDVKSVEVAEDKHALAVLDINPISQGHTLIIPKSPVTQAKNMPSQIFTLAKKIAVRLSKVLQAKSVDIQTELKFGEIVLNVLPSYEHPVSLQSQRSKSSVEDLEGIAQKIRIVKKQRPVRIKMPAAKPSQVLRLKRRIP